MGRSKKQTTEDAIVLENGKWKTPDGMCFNTMDKAIKHVKKVPSTNSGTAIEAQEKVLTKKINDGKDE